MMWVLCSPFVAYVGFEVGPRLAQKYHMFNQWLSGPKVSGAGHGLILRPKMENFLANGLVRTEPKSNIGIYNFTLN